MRLKTIAAVALLGIVTIFAAACGSPKTSTPGFETYTDTTNGFSISVPEAWEPDRQKSGVYFISPSTCAEWYPFGAVTASYAEGYSSAQTYYSEIIGPYTEDFADYKLISTENLTIDEIPAIKVIYTYVDDYGYSVQETFCILVDQGTAWLITGSCDTTCWNIYQGTFNTMSSSFRVLY